jgi:hypothetical protein
MVFAWGSFYQRSRNSLKTGWLLTAGLVAIYTGWVQPLHRMRGIAESRASLAAEDSGVRFEPLSLWRSASPFKTALSADQGVVAGVPGGATKMMSYLASAIPGPPPPPIEDRKMVRTSTLDVIVQNPAQAADEVRKLAERLGGFLVSSQVSGATDTLSASIAIRVPADRFNEAHDAIRKLGVRIENERVEAQDVTTQYVDREARLRNLRAQETQYLGILRQARTVKDTLEVSDKLNEVRGEIEQQQAEFEALSKQVETVAINVSLRGEADAQVFGIHWRPLYQLKFAAREGLEGVADYLASMTSFVFYLPTVLLWFMTILFGSAVGWRILRWSARTFFGWPGSAKQAA